jgi:hypothetical protein
MKNGLFSIKKEKGLCFSSSCKVFRESGTEGSVLLYTLTMYGYFVMPVKTGIHFGV